MMGLMGQLTQFGFSVSPVKMHDKDLFFSKVPSNAFN
jgi:hypothetical protein